MQTYYLVPVDPVRTVGGDHDWLFDADQHLLCRTDTPDLCARRLFEIEGFCDCNDNHSAVTCLACPACSRQMRNETRCDSCRHMWRYHTRHGMCAGVDGKSECHCSRMYDPFWE